MTLSILLDAAAPASQTSSWMTFLPLILIFVVMYFFMIRPQQKKQKEIEKQRASLKTGDKVILSGGIFGKLKEINDTDYVVEIAEGVKIKVEKSAVFAAAQ
ncbi:preprotein translocase subunit YajC [Bacteroidia bacterium]|nr:preprotein translocase subunit YajC [Bacteroidia bacterium]